MTISFTPAVSPPRYLLWDRSTPLFNGFPGICPTGLPFLYSGTWDGVLSLQHPRLHWEEECLFLMLYFNVLFSSEKIEWLHLSVLKMMIVSVTTCSVQALCGFCSYWSTGDGLGSNDWLPCGKAKEESIVSLRQGVWLHWGKGNGIPVGWQEDHSYLGEKARLCCSVVGKCGRL